MVRWPEYDRLAECHAKGWSGDSPRILASFADGFATSRLPQRHYGNQSIVVASLRSDRRYDKTSQLTAVWLPVRGNPVEK